MVQNIVFAGTPEIASKLLQDLISSKKYNIIACYTQPDRPKGRNQLIAYNPVKALALQNNIEVKQPKNFKDPNVIAELQALKPDLMLVFAYGLILPKTVLAIPRLGCLNVHTSLLPKWRGAAPVQHAILAGDQITGISIMQMDEGLDTGNVLHTITCPINPDDTTTSLYIKLQPLATQAILTVLERLNHSDIKNLPQEHQLATYAHKLHKEDAKIDWKNPAIEIDRLIRAFIPKPIAFTSCNNNAINIRIWQAKCLTNLDFTEYLEILKRFFPNISFDNDLEDLEQLIPGTIVRVNKSGIDVITGKNNYHENLNFATPGILRIEKLQFPGSKILTITEILNAPKYKNLFTLGNNFD